MKNLTFGVVDYVIFTIMLLSSTSIGIYFGFIKKSQNTTEEYLMGGRKMQVLPIAISLVASQLSAITMMGVPAEVFAFGINHIFNGLAMSIALFFLWYVVLPVYYNNNLTTCYEYLDLRYDRLTRKIVTLVFVLTYLFLFPLFNYLPSLAFSQVTSINTHLINTIVNIVCVFYTMIGGIRAVIWTDVVQGSIMLGTILFVVFTGINKVGGISEVYNLAKDGQRLNVDFTFDLETRATLWNSLFCGIIFEVAYVGFNQNCVQRLVSLPTLKQSKRAAAIFGIGFILVTVLTCLTGLIMYAYYHSCDPVLLGQVARYDKLVPYFVQDLVGHLNGVPGFFISGIFSAALSTASAAMNSLAGVIYFDYVMPYVQHTESKANFIMKILICLFGIYSILGGFIVEKFASIVQTIYTIDGLAFGAVFGVFTLGMLLPKAHSRAILSAVLISVVTMIAIVLNANGKIQYDALETSAESCASNLSHRINTTFLTTANSYAKAAPPSGFNILKMSFNWYIVMGALLVFVAGTPLSYLIPPKKKSNNVDRKLFSPIVYPLVEYHLTKQDDNNKF